MSDEWPNVCVLCAARGRQTRLKYGHCCAGCADRIGRQLRDIPAMAAMAAACIVPGSGTGGNINAAYGSRPPINLDAVDPALAHVPGHDAPLLVLLEEWERMIRQERNLSPYGPASLQWAVNGPRTAVGASEPQPGQNDTGVTLMGVCAFLAAQVEWIVSEPTFPLEDFAAEVAECARVLRRWDAERDDIGTMVRCPTLLDDGECGYRLHYSDVHEDVTCRRCGTTRSAMTLAAVAMADGREVWLDPEAAATVLGVSESTLLRMARRGAIARSHGRYRVSHVEPVA